MRYKPRPAMNLQALSKYFQKPDLGLLILRAGPGAMIAAFGVMKFLGGPSQLQSVGTAINAIGVDFWPPLFWGFTAAFAELLCGMLLIIGTLFRPAAFILTFVMAVAVASLWGKGFMEFAFPLAMGLIFFGLFWTGPGQLSIQKS